MKTDDQWLADGLKVMLFERLGCIEHGYFNAVLSLEENVAARLQLMGGLMGEW